MDWQSCIIQFYNYRKFTLQFKSDNDPWGWYVYHYRSSSTTKMQLWMLKNIISALFPVRHLFNTSWRGLSLRACGSSAAVTFLPHRIEAILQLLLCHLAPYISPLVALSWHSIGERETHTQKEPMHCCKGVSYALLPYTALQERCVLSLWTRGRLTEIKRTVYRLRKAGARVGSDTC